MQHFPVFGQQSPCVPQAVYPLLHAKAFIPSAPRKPPAKTPAASLRVWRRGAGFARIRATSSNKDGTFLCPFLFAQAL